MDSPPASEKRQKFSRRRPTSRLRLLEKGHGNGRIGFLHLPLSCDRRLSARLQFPATAALCLRAGDGGGGSKGAYLQRARFIAISEFGPRSLIYHEGRAYRVYKAKLPPGYSNRGRWPPGDVNDLMSVMSAAPRINTRSLSAVMPVPHPWAAVHPIRNVLRIDNVETLPAERITANDEDRQRQGFEIQTVFAWPRREGASM